MKSVKPSQITEEYWVYAINESKNKYPESTKNCGKWMIFAYKGKELNNIWESVKKAIEKRLLGNSAKCSTSKDNENSLNKSSGVICVYTYDSHDKKDLKRIAEELFKIENVEKLFYKEDNATREGRYAIRGDKNISKWFVKKDNFMEVLSQ
ncbi:MAG: putative phosphothreonine lyase domain-containing protein [Nanoarchaeota archaeon]